MLSTYLIQGNYHSTGYSEAARQEVEQSARAYVAWLDALQQA